MKTLLTIAFLLLTTVVFCQLTYTPDNYGNDKMIVLDPEFDVTKSGMFPEQEIKIRCKWYDLSNPLQGRTVL